MNVNHFFKTVKAAQKFKGQVEDTALSALYAAWLVWHDADSTLQTRHAKYREIAENFPDAPLPESVASNETVHELLSCLMKAELALVEEGKREEAGAIWRLDSRIRDARFSQYVWRTDFEAYSTFDAAKRAYLSEDSCAALSARYTKEYPETFRRIRLLCDPVHGEEVYRVEEVCAQWTAFRIITEFFEKLNFTALSPFAKGDLLCFVAHPIYGEDGSAFFVCEDETHALFVRRSGELERRSMPPHVQIKKAEKGEGDVLIPVSLYLKGSLGLCDMLSSYTRLCFERLARAGFALSSAVIEEVGG